MTRVKKILVCSLVASLLLLLVAYFVGNHLLNSYSRQALPVLAKRSKRHGVVIEEPSFKQARISGFRTARWTDLRSRMQFLRSEAFDPNRVFDVHVGQAELWLSGSGTVTLEAQNITIKSIEVDAVAGSPVAGGTHHEQIRIQRFRCQFEMELFKPMPGLDNIMTELVGLMKAGATRVPIVAEGLLEFSLKGNRVKIGIQVARGEGGQSLVLSAQDLRPVSELFDEDLTDAEIELIATYPLRIAQLLRIKDDAESTARTAKERNEKIPEDAYRHVLWSFLLTNKYDVAFARRVTDAHEQGDTGNTPAEREMDYHNNAIGRRYAEQKVRRNQLLKRVMSDVDVIREPR